MPSWLKHHKNIADRLILVDHNSTDCSRDIIETQAPDAIILDSRLQEFDAWQNDLEIMEIEKRFYQPGQVTLVLNTTEFLWGDAPKETLKDHYNDQLYDAWGIGSIIMVDSPNAPPGTWGFKDPGHIRRKRYAHCVNNGNYQLGRHGTNLLARDIDDLSVLYMAFSPWPQVKERKLQVQTRIPLANKQAGLGFEHLVTPEQLDRKYEEYLALSGDLLNLPEFARGLDRVN